MPTNDVTNNSFATATVLAGVTSSPQSRNENLLGKADNPFDFYKFTTTGSSNLRIDLTGITGDVKLSLYKSPLGGTPKDTDIPITIRDSNTQRISDSYTSTSDPALGNVPAGTYYVKVELANAALQGQYNLFVSASSKEVSNSLLFRDASGSLKSWQITGTTLTDNSTFDSTTTTKAPSNLQIISTGDFDGDGINDIVWRDTTQNTLLIWFMSNGTQVRDALSVQDATGQALVRGPQWTIGTVGDVDGDGLADIIWRNSSSGESDIWFMSGNQVSSTVTLTRSGSGLGLSWQIVGFANADNKFGGDLLWRNSITSQLAIWNLSRNGFEAGTRILAEVIPQSWKILDYRDLNGDGIADFLWRNEEVGQVALWKMGTSKIDNSRIYGGIATACQLVANEDMSGDGRPHPFWRNTQTGDMYVWNIKDDGITIEGKLVYIEGATGNLTQIKLADSVVGEWTAVVQDWNGDRKADILWRNSRTNNFYAWIMEENVVKQGPIVKNPSVPTQNIQLASNFKTTGLNYGAYRTTNIVRVSSTNFPQTTAGSSPTTAFNVGVLEGKGSFKDTVGGIAKADKTDWYKFTIDPLNDSLLTNISVDSSTIKVDLLKEGNNTPITDTTSALSKGSTYYARVQHSSTTTSNVITPYTLTIEGKPGITNLKALDQGFVLSKNSITLDALETKNTIDITSFKFDNIGDFSASNVEVGFYLSKNGTFELADDKLITLTAINNSTQTITSNLLVRSLVAKGGQVVLSDLRLSLPSKDDKFWDASANYSIIAVIDPRNVLTSEKKKDDNTQVFTISTLGVGNADLLGKAFSVSGTIKPSTTISGNFQIGNIGSRGTAVQGKSVNVKIYISDQKGIDSSDYLAYETTITTDITPQGTLTQAFTFNLPSLTSTVPDDERWIVYWENLMRGKTANSQFSVYVGMVIDFIDDANTTNNSNQVTLNLDQTLATAIADQNLATAIS